MTVDKLNRLLCDPSVQNLRETRPPKPFSGSLTSTALKTELSDESAIKVTTT